MLNLVVRKETARLQKVNRQCLIKKNHSQICWHKSPIYISFHICHTKLNPYYSSESWYQNTCRSATLSTTNPMLMKNETQIQVTCGGRSLHQTASESGADISSDCFYRWIRRKQHTAARCAPGSQKSSCHLLCSQRTLSHSRWARVGLIVRAIQVGRDWIPRGPSGLWTSCL